MKWKYSPDQTRIPRLFLPVPGIFLLCLFISAGLAAQDRGSGKSRDEKKLEKERKEMMAFARTDSLVRTRQFVFQEEYSLQAELFVVVDSLYGEVQNGMRNNLQGRVSEFEVKKDDKRRNLSVIIKMRGDLYTADVFLYIGPDGKGKATVKGGFTGSEFSFYGDVLDFEHASIHSSPSHMIR
jgi:hypothetical protein